MPKNPEVGFSEVAQSQEEILETTSKKEELLQAVEAARQKAVGAKTLHDKVKFLSKLAVVEEDANLDPHYSFNQAKKFASKIRGLEKSSSLELVADSQAGLGLFGEAKETAAEIPDREFRAQALGSIAKSEAYSGLFEEAKETIKGMPDKRKRSFTFQSIAYMQVDSGDLRGALETAKLVETEEIRKPLSAYLRKRDKELREKANLPRESIEANLGKLKEGDNYKYHQLALAAAKAGHFDLAKEACLKIVDPDYRAAIELNIKGIEKGKAFWDKFRVKK